MRLAKDGALFRLRALSLAGEATHGHHRAHVGGSR
ncbi:hypothetical protein WA016_03241 [Myxococcus stipitatus]